MKKKEIKKKKCSMCKKEFKTKHNTKAYCEECYRYYQKQYRQKNRGYYLYVIMDKSKVVLYVGATEFLNNRLNSHLSCNSNIAELMMSDNWDSIKYLDITSLVENREELYLLENSLIELYDTEYNTKLNIIKNIDRLRELSLISELSDANLNWITYVTKEDYKNKKVI